MKRCIGWNIFRFSADSGYLYLVIPAIKGMTKGRRICVHRVDEGDGSNLVWKVSEAA
jgi:hypothetical protein